MDVVTSSAEPPLPYETDQFGFVYAVSVFTHLEQAKQSPWLSELGRITRPGGFIALTLQGRHFAEQALTDEELERFQAGELVVVGGGLSGMNACAVFHPIDWLTRNLPAGLTVADHQPGAATGTGHQDLALLAVG
jgi:SAM-dependent methyltransferase